MNRKFNCVKQHRIGKPFRNDGFTSHFEPVKMLLAICKDCDKVLQVKE